MICNIFDVKIDVTLLTQFKGGGLTGVKNQF